MNLFDLKDKAAIVTTRAVSTKSIACQPNPALNRTR